jgi:excinuclease ABC subunit C
VKEGSAGEGWRRSIGQAPPEPGVYIMRSAGGRVLYIGKAKSLRSRVRSYLRPEDPGGKTSLLLREAREIEFLVTDSELEALILENSLIKKWKPKYNISLRDDKTYPFLRLSLQEEYPTLTVVRRPLDDGARYFGPYVPAGAMRKTLHLMRRIFPLRQCRKVIGGRPGRPCLNYQLGRCLAPCAGRADRAEYGELVRGVTLFLQGRGRDLVAGLRRQMKVLAREESFEEAAVLRDRIANLEATMEKQKVHLPGRGDLDVLGTASLGEKMAVAVLHGNHGRIVGARSFVLDRQPDSEKESEGMGSFIRAFYDRASRVPPEILLPREAAGAEALTAWLRRRRGGPVALKVPRSGPLRSLVAMATRNALRDLEKARVGTGARGAVMTELGKAAGAGTGLDSLAAVDVSSLSGTDAVASLVWWEEGHFAKKRYRRFRIRGASTQDDFAMIAEAVERLAARVDEGAWRGPDALMVDGGRGHLAAARMALKASRWSPSLLCALAKGRGESSLDALYVEGRREAVELKRDSPLLKLVMAVRDEAHRFAITYHRRLRQKRGRKSVMDDVPGLGPVRKRNLLRTFGSLKGIRRASLEDLAAVPGMPREVAKILYRHLRE